ncbi:HET-domain-containing protein [Pholiota conissans]|uniref:HET-domain-containing protein n=1 Tax=Pholiota conissans TaxID=109636 RepID=A0A9P6D091_9AGAR|nr:HET-domain-containing protein [Pholiota conissans]
MSRAFKPGIEKLIDQSTPTKPSGFNDPLISVCSACRAGPFSHEGFRQAISSGRYTGSSGYRYTTTWQKILQAVVNEACNWCHILRRTRAGVRADKALLISGETVEVRFQVSVKYTAQDSSHIKIYFNGLLVARYTMVLYANEGDGVTIDMSTASANLIWPWKNRDEIYYTKASECIQACSDHEYCPSYEEVYLPTRVIDCSDPAKPCLIETQGVIKGYYCTLSYVWGGDQLHKTTTSNIDTYIREGINVDLPQTIADAIVVTNKLGFQYLWVDALCIIQDSNEDKVKELESMTRIYCNAHLTISVLSAYSAYEGFLPGRRAPDVLPFYLADEASTPGWMLLKCGVQFPGRLSRQLGLSNSSMHAPLRKRSWSLQESILSPRQIIFQPPDVLYKCRSFQAVGIDEDTWSTNTRKLATDHIIFSEETHPTLNKDKFYEQWQNILEDYSKRKSTLSSDKLVAVASVAEILQSHVQDQYIAGLWRRNLLDDLLWEVIAPMGPDETHLPRPITYRAPTWSWASVDGELQARRWQYDLACASYKAEIQMCKATPKFISHPLGEITDAKLTIAAKIRPLMRDGRGCSFIEHVGTKIDTGGLKYWYWTAPAGNILETLSTKSSSDGGLKGGFVFDCLEGTEQDCQTNFYVMLLHAGKYYTHYWVDGLLLIQVDNMTDHYRRVAKFNFKHEYQWLDWLDTEPLKLVTLI